MFASQFEHDCAILKPLAPQSLNWNVNGMINDLCVVEQQEIFGGMCSDDEAPTNSTSGPTRSTVRAPTTVPFARIRVLVFLFLTIQGHRDLSNSSLVSFCVG